MATSFENRYMTRPRAALGSPRGTCATADRTNGDWPLSTIGGPIKTITIRCRTPEPPNEMNWQRPIGIVVDDSGGDSGRTTATVVGGLKRIGVSKSYDETKGIICVRNGRMGTRVSQQASTNTLRSGFKIHLCGHWDGFQGSPALRVGRCRVGTWGSPRLLPSTSIHHPEAAVYSGRRCHTV